MFNLYSKHAEKIEEGNLTSFITALYRRNVTEGLFLSHLPAVAVSDQIYFPPGPQECHQCAERDR